LLLLSGNIHPNPGPVGLSSHFTSPSCKPLNPYLTLACQNVRSISTITKNDTIFDFITSCKLDILCLTETHLNRDKATSSLLYSLTPLNYSLFRLDRPNGLGNGGGLAIIHHTSLKPTILSLPHYDSFECLASTISAPAGSFNLVLLYRPPSSSITDFFTQFGSLLESLASSSTELVITGDFNLHVDCKSDPDTVIFMQLLYDFNLTQLVSFPTHNKGHTLDLLITHTSSNLVPFVTSDDICISDHIAVVASLDIPKPELSKTSFTYRSTKLIDTSSFSADILASPLVSNSSSDLDTLVSSYNSTLTALLDKHAPSRTTTSLSRTPNPWFNSNLFLQKRRKRQFERKWRNTKLPSDLSNFRRQCHYFNRLLFKSKSDYYKNLISSAPNARAVWKSFKSVLHRHPVRIAPSLPQLADKFSRFFSDKISSLRANLPQSNLNPETAPSIPPPLLTFLEPASCEEIRNIILKSPPSTSVLDPIPTTLLVSCIDALLPIIITIVNRSLTSGCFPSDCKIASISPLLKKTGLDSEELKNYRPISNLSFLSKLIERVVASRLTAHLSSNNLFNPNQSAYRKFHSTETALLSVQNDLLKAMDKGHVSALLLLDLSAAFDTVDHDILLHRLESWFGISNTALAWFKSYLTDRQQTVRTGDSTSAPSNLLFGVPQGSVLGPILFSLYTTPLSSLISDHPNINHQLYADDTQIYLSFSSRDITSALLSIKNCAVDIFSWMTANKLSVNPDKTEYLLITNKKDLSAPPLILDSNITLSSSDHAKNLGVIFQSDLSLDSYISATVKCCFHHIRDLRRIRSSLTLKSATILANALVHSRLDYCNSLLYGLPKQSLQRLQKVQNCLSRVVKRASLHDHTTPLLKSLHWLPVSYRINYKICLLTYRVLSVSQPTYLLSQLSKRRNSHAIRSSSFLPLHTPDFSRETMGRRSFSYASPRLWNALPQSVRADSDYPSFRRHLKTHFFQSAFFT